MEVSGKRPAYSDDLDTGVPCDPCLIDNVNENAQFYCTDCDEFLCDTCAGNHRKSKASRQHQLLDRDEMPRKKISNVQDKFCAKHDGKLIEFLCDKHDTFCCSVCFSLYHGQCCVKYIDDLATGYSSSQEYKSLLKQIRDIEKQIAEDTNKRQNDSFDVTNCLRQLKADIQVFRSEINSTIDALEKELIHQAEQKTNDDLKNIQSVDTIYEQLRVEMSEISSTLELLGKCKQNKQLFISAKKAQIQVKEYNDKTQSMLQENSVRRYAFARNEYILKTLNSPSKLGSLEMKNEGDRRATKTEQKEKGLVKEDNPIIGKLGARKKEVRGEEQHTKYEKLTIKTDIFKPTKVKFMKDINMNHKNDTESVAITGSVSMSSEHLAVADRGNYSIKVIDLRSDTITCYIKLDDKPWDITCMDPETLIVTCGTILVFLRYDGELSVVKKVPIESGCKGITYRKGTLFVTFDGNHPSVKILNHEGKVLQTFKHNDKGQNLFNCPWYITVNSDGDTMYVSDYDKHTVTSLNMDGKVCNIYKHENLGGPAGLTMGDDDSIYVAGYWSYNIHQLTPTCTPVRILLERNEGLRFPWTVLYYNTDKTLYVSNNSSGNPLNVYTLG